MTSTPVGGILLPVMLNPLAIGVTIGGLLLDVFVPRPKPRYGALCELSPRTRPAGSRTPRLELERYEGSPVASG